MAVIICDKCSKEVRQEKRGTLTQWIFDDSSCSCAKVTIEVSESDKNKSVCPRCFNPKWSRRTGSLTQWVFGKSQCKCSPESGITDVSLPRHVSKPSAEPEAEDDFAGSDLPFAKRYKPLSCIARSPASVVYKCFDRELGRNVAIKTLVFADPELLMRFQQEARATGLLKHPNIVEVLDFGIGSGGASYMVLEFVDAINLDDWLSTRGPLSEAESVSIFAGVCRALFFAHSKGIYHRDLKPQNILISNNLESKLIDFGLAFILSPDSNTKGFSLAGTPSYMSPDQFLGRPYDQRSEIYSLGCVLFACLTGSPPFQGDSALEIARRHAEEQAPTLNDLNPDRHFSRRLEHVINRCLEKNPALRYSSILELADDLQIKITDSNRASEEMSDDNQVSNEDIAIFSATDNRSWQPDSQGPEDLVTSASRPSSAGSSSRLKQIFAVRNILFMVPLVVLISAAVWLMQAQTPIASPKTEALPMFDTADLAFDHVDKPINELTNRVASVKPPDERATRALMKAYDSARRIREYDKLPELEKEILKYCPDGPVANECHIQFYNMAYILSNRKLYLDSARCYESTLQALRKFEKEDSEHSADIEHDIGYAYWTADDLIKARSWLERANEHYTKLGVMNAKRLSTLLHLGGTYQRLKNYEASIASLQAAEKIWKSWDARENVVAMQGLADVYMNWATTLVCMNRFDQAETKVLKALRTNSMDANRIQQANGLLAEIKKRRELKSGR
jgi:serine/threonine protein kinase